MLLSLNKHDFYIYGIALLVLILCLDIEFEWMLIPCIFPQKVEVINKIVLAISYSYISAVLFYFVVSDIPFKRRKRSITPLLRYLLFMIEDQLRNCMEVVYPLSFTKPKNREDFCEGFSKSDLRESSFLNKDKSKFSVLKEHRAKIIENLHILLAYREYLDDDVFQELNEILRSEFIRKGVILPPDVEDVSSIDFSIAPTNQKEVGECIYDLYEKLCGFLKNE